MMTITSLALYSLARTGNSLISAQQSQFAADASALGCVLAQDNLQREIAGQIAEQNFSQIVEIEVAVAKCSITVENNRVVRRAVAVSVGGLDLPTLQR